MKSKSAMKSYKSLRKYPNRLKASKAAIPVQELGSIAHTWYAKSTEGRKVRLIMRLMQIRSLLRGKKISRMPIEWFSLFFFFWISIKFEIKKQPTIYNM